MSIRALCFSRLLFVAVCAVGFTGFTPRAEAVALVGEWQGNWNTTTAGAATATFDLYFVSQTSGGAVTGIFDWTCTSGVTCSGLEIVSGTLQPSGALAMSTTALVQPVVGIGSSNYTATVTPDSQHIVDGVIPNTAAFAANRAASSISPDFSVLGGIWEGNWQTPSGNGQASFDLVFTSQTPGASGFDLTGYFDWTCTVGLPCFGREEVAGTLLPDRSIALVTTALVPPVLNLGNSTYSLLLIGNGSELIGVTEGNLLMRANRVPEPATALLALMAMCSIWLVRLAPRSNRNRELQLVRVLA